MGFHWGRRVSVERRESGEEEYGMRSGIGVVVVLTRLDIFVYSC